MNMNQVKGYTNGRYKKEPDDIYKHVVTPVSAAAMKVPRWMVPGGIASEIARLSDVTLTEIGNLEGKDLGEYILYCTKEPIARQCINLKAMRAAVTFGVYEHDNKEIQDFVHQMFANLDGGIERIISQLASAMPFGFSAAEIVWQYDNNIRKWIIKKFIFLDPRRIQFKGGKGRIEYAIYRDRTRKYLPYFKIIHAVNGAAFDFNDPFGVPEAKAALPYIKFKNAVLSDMLIAGKNLATGILVGKVNSTKSVNVYDQEGKPRGTGEKMTAAQAMSKQFENLENNSYLVTDVENDVTALQVGDGSQFWQYSLNLVDQYIKASFSVPQMMFSGNSQTMGPGGATLSNQQMSIMDATIGSIVKQLQEQMIEKALAPVIKLNFGAQKNYGQFVRGKTEDPNVELNKLGQLISAVSMGILSADDMEVQNKIRHMLGLAKIDAKEKMAQLNLQMALQNMQAAQQAEQQGHAQVTQQHILEDAGMAENPLEAQQRQEQQMTQQQQQPQQKNQSKKPQSAAEENQPQNRDGDYP